MVKSQHAKGVCWLVQRWTIGICSFFCSPIFEAWHFDSPWHSLSFVFIFAPLLICRFLLLCHWNGNFQWQHTVGSIVMSDESFASHMLPFTTRYAIVSLLSGIDNLAGGIMSPIFPDIAARVFLPPEDISSRLIWVNYAGLAEVYSLIHFPSATSLQFAKLSSGQASSFSIPRDRRSTHEGYRFPQL